MKLSSIGHGGKQLEADAARHFLLMEKDAIAAGHSVEVNEAHRTEAQQQALYDAWIKRGKKPQPIVVNPKVKKSAHQLGLSVDLAVAKHPKFYAWLQANAAKYGFFKTTPGEPWHWTFIPGRATVKP